MMWAADVADGGLSRWGIAAAAAVGAMAAGGAGSGLLGGAANAPAVKRYQGVLYKASLRALDLEFGCRQHRQFQLSSGNIGGTNVGSGNVGGTNLGSGNRVPEL